MIYQFRDAQSGEIVERYMPMSEAPENGTTIDVDGRTLVRVPSLTQNVVVPNVHFVSHQLPQGWAYAKKFDAWGSPCFDSKRELDESLAKANAHGEHYQWDQ